MLPTILDLGSLAQLYSSGATTPIEVMEAIVGRRKDWPDRAVFISEVSAEALRTEALRLMADHPDPRSLPLWGVPFAVKDNIDVAGLPTTAACPAFAYRPHSDAFVVARLRAVGAIVIGKTNLDQFATGLNGTRSPYGAARSVFDAAYISGGSSSGSAVAVAAGLCSFALGTDTAGSGRVPAAFNNIVGIKPTPGLLSTSGVVPACRSLDCVSILSATVADGVAVREVAEGYDAADPFSRRRPATIPAPQAGLRLGVLAGREREFFGDSAMEHIYDHAIASARDLGATIVPVDYTPFREAAELLYGGPWVAERLAAIEDFFASHAGELDPTVRAVMDGARTQSAVDAFKGQYRLAALRRRAEQEWFKIDFLLLPTAPTTFTVEEMLADPIARNSQLGLYTNFVNLFDCAGVAVPAGFDSGDHLPGGVSLIGPEFSDGALSVFASALHRAAGRGLGRDRTATIPTALPASADPQAIPIVVVGAHLSGMPLNNELTRAGGRFIRSCRTQGDYRLFVLPDTVPPKPGLVRDPGYRGDGIAVEVWQLAAQEFAAFVARIPAPLGIGKITLEDGSICCGFLCEEHATQGAEDITHFGGWRGYVESLAMRVPAAVSDALTP